MVFDDGMLAEFELKKFDLIEKDPVGQGCGFVLGVAPDDSADFLQFVLDGVVVVGELGDGGSAE